MSSETITRNDLKAILDEVLPSPSFMDFFYPVGSYYETSDTSFDPNVSWGGTWVLDSAGKVTVARDANDADFDTVGETGGVKTHLHSTGDFTLGTNHIPAHTHGNKTLNGTFDIRKTYDKAYNVVLVDGICSSSNSGSGGQTATNGTATSLQRITINASHEHSSVGGGQAHNHGNTGSGSNMQPYIVVNRWHRTA